MIGQVGIKSNEDTFSITFPKKLNRDIGLYLLGCFLSPFLNMAVTMASFHKAG